MVKQEKNLPFDFDKDFTSSFQGTWQQVTISSESLFNVWFKSFNDSIQGSCRNDTAYSNIYILLEKIFCQFMSSAKKSEKGLAAKSFER